MSETDPSKSLHPYSFYENQDLRKLDSLSINTDEMTVTENTDTLYTDGCMSSVVLIIVVKMSNGKVWHGMRHETDADNYIGIGDGFNTLMNEFEKTGNTVTVANHYLVTIPELKDKRIHDTEKLIYVVSVISPDVNVPQIKSDMNGNISERDLKDINASVNVKLSNGLIQVKYDDPYTVES